MTLEEFKEFANVRIAQQRYARKKEIERKRMMEAYEAELEDLSREHKYQIKNERGHYVVLRDGEFYCSADTYGEAAKEIPN